MQYGATATKADAPHAILVYSLPGPVLEEPEENEEEETQLVPSALVAMAP